MANSKPAPTAADHDEVAEGVHSAVLFIQRNYLAVLGGLVALLIALLVYSSIEGSRAKASSEANAAIVGCVAQMAQLLQVSDPAQRKTAAAKLVEDLDKIISQYPSNPLSAQALFLKGRAYYEIDDFENAQKAYESYIAKASGDTGLAAGEIALGYTYENHAFLVGDQGQEKTLLNSAYGEFKKGAERAPDSFLHFYALSSMARCLEAMHQNDDAMKIYQQIIDSRPAPYLPAEEPKDAKDGGATGSKAVSETDFLRNMLERNQANFSFAATSKIRLDSLKAQAAMPKAEQPAVAAPAGTPAAAPAASPAAATPTPAP